MFSLLAVAATVGVGAGLAPGAAPRMDGGRQVVTTHPCGPIAPARTAWTDLFRSRPGTAPTADADPAPGPARPARTVWPVFEGAAAPAPMPGPGWNVDRDEGAPAASDTGGGALFRGILQDLRRLPSRETLWIALAGTGLALAAHPLDDSLNARLAGDGNVHRFFLPGKFIGFGPFQVAAAAGLWAAGRGDDRSDLARLGVQLLRAQLLTGVLTYGIQFAVRRERPDGTDVYAFPSGHASMTFATAAVLDGRFGRRVGIPMYLLGTYVAASRLHENRHHLSDVLAGATLGVIVGRTVMRDERRNPSRAPASGSSPRGPAGVGPAHRLDDASGWRLVPVAGPAGAALLLTRTTAARHR